MLRVYGDILRIIAALRPVFDQIAKHDPALADQGRRASKSVALQVAEGSEAHKRNRVARYKGAAGEMVETLAVVDVASADGAIAGIDEGLRDDMHRVIATLRKCAR
jgi:four helix bundle protein